MVSILISTFLQAVEKVISFLLAGFGSFPLHMYIFAKDYYKTLHYNIPKVGDFLNLCSMNWPLLQ